MNSQAKEFQSPRGDFGFLKRLARLRAVSILVFKFQSPRGDFGFLKTILRRPINCSRVDVSIPSRGFWFFEDIGGVGVKNQIDRFVSIPSRGFWFFEGVYQDWHIIQFLDRFQSPRGDFGFLKSVPTAQFGNS
mgnify:CR=1 FL=1